MLQANKLQVASLHRLVCFGSVNLFSAKLELWQKLLLLTVLKTTKHVSYTCVNEILNMNLPKLSELSPYYQRIDLLEKVVTQVKKDFNWFNFEITFTGKEETPYVELYNQILPLIDEMLNDDYPKLLAMLYRIDIDDEFLNRKLKESEQSDTHEVITDLILKRELQKVIIREMYSSK